MSDIDRSLTGDQLKQAFREARGAYSAPAYPGSLIDDLGLDHPSLFDRLKRWRWPAAVAAMLAIAAGVWWVVDNSIGKSEPTKAAPIVESPVPSNDITPPEPPLEATPAIAERDTSPTAPSSNRIEAITLLAHAALGELLIGQRFPPMPSALSFSSHAFTAVMPAMPRLSMPSPGGLPRPNPSAYSSPPSS